MSEHQTEAPPPGEQIHMPEQSILPLLNAVGVAGMIISITLSIFLVIAFAILFLVTTAVWIRSAVRDVNELPAEH